MRIGVLPVIVALLAFPVTWNSQIPQATRKILLNVSVEANDNWVEGLKRDNFSLFLDDVPQTITTFNRGDLPSTVGILIDRSPSPLPLRAISEVLAQAITKGSAGNEYFIMTFDQSQTIIAGLTHDRSVVEEALTSIENVKILGLPDRVIPLYGKSSRLRDALKLGIEQLREGKNDRKVLMVFTDGFDSGSKTSAAEITRISKGSEVIIYYLDLFKQARIGEPGEVPISRAVLMEDLTSITGGKMMLANDPAKLKNSLFLVFDELEHQYQIGFFPKGVRTGQDMWHKIKVNVTISDAPKKIGKPRIITRQGFYSAD